MTKESFSKAEVYIVATPIGNKSDLSKRAVDVLKSVDVIACEDCRTSSVLMDFYEIGTKLISYHKFNEKQRTQELLSLVSDGKKIALISDAGTPCISDPGRILVKELFENGVKVTSVPGASAVVSFLSMIPRDNEEFAFVGFLPRVKNQQISVLKKLQNIDTVFYESPNRLIETLKNIQESFGCEKKVAVGRELTKKFEEVKVGCVSDVITYFEENILKGEIVCVVYAQNEVSQDEADMVEKIKVLKSMNYSDKDISKILSALYDVNKNKIYKISVNL